MAKEINKLYVIFDNETGKINIWSGRKRIYLSESTLLKSLNGGTHYLPDKYTVKIFEYTKDWKELK